MGKKTAVVYDKWLRSMGGGEVVACNIAKILHDDGYEVTFICGKAVDKETIKNKLNVDLTGIPLVEIWSDEGKIKKLVKGSDVFVNTSFIDYTYGCAKKNIYYTHFPKEPYNSIREMLFTKFMFPVVTKFIKPLELMNDAEVTTVKNNEPAYLLEDENRIAISYLQPNKPHVIEFALLLSSFYQSLVKSIKFNVEEAKIIDKKVTIDHYRNQINFQLTIEPQSPTIYLTLSKDNSKATKKEDKVYLLYPKVQAFGVYEPLYKLIYRRLNNKLRAGVFANPLERLKTYQVILDNSLFTQKWVKNYWKRDSRVVYPPVEMLFEKHNPFRVKKKKWICSVGRFFKLGHGKKQEILIRVFKDFYNQGRKDWQLHLVGGVGSEDSSAELVEKLKKEAEGYPIFFHLNVSRKEVEDVYLKSRIYWHAAGFGENENKNPIRFEHFGIAPIEAISAGCIPILYNGGGLKEIIGKIGLPEENHLFGNVNELVKKTTIWADKEIVEPEWQRIFQQLEDNFSTKAFKKNFLEDIKD